MLTVAHRQLLGYVTWTLCVCGFFILGRGSSYARRSQVLVTLRLQSQCVPSSYKHTSSNNASKQLLNHIATLPLIQNFESTPTIWSILLFRTCWLTAQLLDPSHSWHVTATPALLKAMCCIFLSCMVGSVSLDGESNHANFPAPYLIHRQHEKQLLKL